MASKLTPAQRVALARHPERPGTADFIKHLFTDFFEQRGDRLCAEDGSILGGVALFHGKPVTVVGHRKGRSLEENLSLHFGMPSPEGYRKAQRLMLQAEKFRRPVITFIDTPGAYPGLEAEARGQAEAIARTLAPEPSVLFMDEPLSNLDAKLRLEMRYELQRLHVETGSTFVYVTHDQTEAMTLGDRIVIMKDGFIQQIGTPQEVFDQPANLFVAGFIGSPQMNFFDGELEKKDGKYQLKVGEATVVLGGKAQELLTGKGVGERKVTVGIRPEHIAFAAAPGSDTVSSKVDVSEMMGSEVYLHVNAVGRDVVLRIPTTDLPAEHRAGIPYGTEINFAFRPDLIHLFDPETEKNLMY